MHWVALICKHFVENIFSMSSPMSSNVFLKTPFLLFTANLSFTANLFSSLYFRSKSSTYPQIETSVLPLSHRLRAKSTLLHPGRNSSLPHSTTFAIVPWLIALRLLVPLGFLTTLPRRLFITLPIRP